MKWYKCFIVGENFPGVLIQESDLVGFYTTRFVQAKNPKEAENIALSDLRDEEGLELPKGLIPSSDAKVYFEEIIEISDDEVSEVQPGVVFYVMGT